MQRGDSYLTYTYQSDGLVNKPSDFNWVVGRYGACNEGDALGSATTPMEAQRSTDGHQWDPTASYGIDYRVIRCKMGSKLPAYSANFRSTVIAFPMILKVWSSL